MRETYLLLLIAFLLTAGCDSKKTNKKLPVLGIPTIETNVSGGVETKDTLAHRIKDFSFLNQDSAVVTNTTLDGKIYVADFFFTSCPSICPVMKKQLLRVNEKFIDNDQVAIVSHTIDPGHDSVELLKDYAERLEVSTPKWQFLTGDLFQIYDIAETSYMVFAEEDATAPGGFVHSGALILVDKDRHVRGVYDGTVAEQVDLLLNDMDILLKEYEK